MLTFDLAPSIHLRNFARPNSHVAGFSFVVAGSDEGNGMATKKATRLSDGLSCALADTAPLPQRRGIMIQAQDRNQRP
jgi:hypothetical protein